MRESYVLIIFFFSSRRRHTRFDCDWSSDVCSSDLYRVTNAVAIANADLVIKKSLDGEIFSELAESKIAAAQKALPIMVRVHLVDDYVAVVPSVARQIGLRMTIDIELVLQSQSRDQS